MFIIAEIGSNFKDLSDCLESIEKAAECGAHACKFQMFTHREMYGYGPDTDLSIKREWLPSLAGHCDDHNIELMVTGFSEDGLKAIDPFVKRHKIASSDCLDPFMLDVARETLKPVYVSTGGKSLHQIDKIVQEWSGPLDNLNLFYCEASYPSHNFNPYKFDTLMQLGCEVGVDVGLSDHTLNCYPLVDAPFYEKHVNFCGPVGSADAPHSLDEWQFRRYVDFCNGKWEWLTEADKPMQLYHNKRLIVTQRVEEGEEFRFRVNYGIHRSKVSNPAPVSPMAWDSFDGKIAMRAAKPGDPLSYQHIRTEI